MPTLLLVDDDESSRATLGALLEDDGFAVHERQSSAAAREFLASSAPLDVVVLDQHLGDGLGSDLLPAIRESMPRTKIVLMSGSVDAHELPRTADASFVKGEAFEDLARLLRGLLGSTEG